MVIYGLNNFSGSVNTFSFFFNIFFWDYYNQRITIEVLSSYFELNIGDIRKLLIVENLIL